MMTRVAVKNKGMQDVSRECPEVMHELGWNQIHRDSGQSEEQVVVKN